MINVAYKKFTAVIFTLIIILTGAVGYFVFLKNPDQPHQPSPILTSKDELLNWQIYRDEKNGVEIKYPQSWYAYGDKNAFANEDLLSWRGFIPYYEPKKSMEEQELLILAVLNKNPNSTFEIPKRFITHNNPDEKWEQITINGYTGTKITDTKTNKVTNYIFEHNGKLYNFNASLESLFEKILPTLKFF